MTASTVGSRTRRPLLRPVWSARLRQLSGAVFVLWFVVAALLAMLTFVVEPRWIGWVVVAWFIVLLAFVLAVRLANARLRRAWLGVIRQLGWQHTPSAPELVERWPFPPFTLDPEAEVQDVTEGRYRGRGLYTGRFEYVVGRHQAGFDFVDLEVDRPLPPLQVLPAELVPLAAPGERPPRLDLEADAPADYRLVTGDAGLAAAVLHGRALEVLAKVPPFGFACEGRRFVALLPGYRSSGTAVAHLDAACDLLALVPELVWQAGEQWAETTS